MGICRSRYSRRSGRGNLRLPLAAQAECLSHRGTLFRVGRGGQRVIPAQSPSLEIFIRAQTMPCADVSTKHLGAVAAIETDHILVAYRLPYRHSRYQNFFGLTRPSKPSKRSMNRRNEFRDLTRSNRMMPNITLDDSGGEMRIDLVRIPVSDFRHYCFLPLS